MTPEQLREHAKQWDDDGRYSIGEVFRAHAAALEENARVRDELLGVKEYREKNPLGGPAKVFDAMADQIRAGDDFNRVIADYGWCPVDRAERAEAALAERDAEIARLKRFARKLASAVDQALSDDTLSGREINELLINGLAEAPAGFLEAP